MKVALASVSEVTSRQICRPLVFAFVLLVTTAAALRAQVPNPVCWIPFNEGTGPIAHDAVGTNNATLLGGASWTTGNNQPYALSLPGTVGSYADIRATSFLPRKASPSPHGSI